MFVIYINIIFGKLLRTNSLNINIKIIFDGNKMVVNLFPTKTLIIM